MISASIFEFFYRFLCQNQKMLYLCTRFRAQMAESVDALVSNTSGATRAGSTPALGTRLKSNEGGNDKISTFFFAFFWNNLYLCKRLS